MIFQVPLKRSVHFTQFSQRGNGEGGCSMLGVPSTTTDEKHLRSPRFFKSFFGGRRRHFRPKNPSAVNSKTSSLSVSKFPLISEMSNTNLMSRVEPIILFFDHSSTKKSIYLPFLASSTSLATRSRAIDHRKK